MSVIPLSDQVDTAAIFITSLKLYKFSEKIKSLFYSVATETQNVNRFKERCIDTIKILTPGFSAPEEELSERDIIMINRGMAIRRTSDTYGAFPPLDVPSPPCQPYPGHPGQWSPYHHNQSQRYLGYSGPYLGYGPSRQPPGQVDIQSAL